MIVLFLILLYFCEETNTSSSFWELFIAVIGGGLIVLLYQILQDLVKNHREKEAIKTEIQMIYNNTSKFLALGFIHQHNVQNIYMPVFDSNPCIIVAFKTDDQQKILEFYDQIFWLRFRDNDNILLNNMLKQPTYSYDAYENTRKDIADLKIKIRERLLELGSKILSKKE